MEMADRDHLEEQAPSMGEGPTAPPALGEPTHLEHDPVSRGARQATPACLKRACLLAAAFIAGAVCGHGDRASAGAQWGGPPESTAR